MATLTRELRRSLENTVREARRVAEVGARKVIEQLAVHHHEPYTSMTPEQRDLRNALRAHGRQLGDRRDSTRGTQAIDRLTTECAYEHWHRMLFARFLAETNLLIEPESGMDITLEDCQELARERGEDWLELASQFAERMLPQIFRTNDPVLKVALPPETRAELEKLLKALTRDVFIADDSLGWVYQYWQADKKDEVNRSEKKIGADELPAVTQLFTEDYMVFFLLHNTLGAWWAGKVLAAKPELANAALSEEELRAACSVEGVEWTYLRFVREGEGPWRPAAGSFEEWPKAAKDITVLDPCMGSGHFLVFALPMLAALRAEEEGLSVDAAVVDVLRVNLFGLEIDPRCTQIAAFNLALAAWRQIGHRPLPPMHLACSGLSLGVTKTEWLRLAERAAHTLPMPPRADLLGTEDNLFSDAMKRGLERLYDLFARAPWLGSLINPSVAGGDLIERGFADLEPVLAQVLAKADTVDLSEMAVAAQGLAKAAEILSTQFTLVATNVPYLGRGKQDETLKEFCEKQHPNAKADLATCFVERCLAFCKSNGSAAIVTPQNWWFLGTYRSLRDELLLNRRIDCVVTLGEEAWQSFGDRGPVAALMIIDEVPPIAADCFAGIDALVRPTIEEKVQELREGGVRILNQRDEHASADHRITVDPPVSGPLLLQTATCNQGIGTADANRYVQRFWEVRLSSQWDFYQMAPVKNIPISGCHSVLRWENGQGPLATSPQARICGQPAWGKRGIAIAVTRDLCRALYLGGKFDCTLGALVSSTSENADAVGAFVLSNEFLPLVRQIDKALSVTESSLLKVPFDPAKWKQVVASEYPSGLPRATSDDPTQWIFNGHPKGSESPLHIAVARLLGYQWPRQIGHSFPDCPKLGEDQLSKYAEQDGIVALSSVKGAQSATARLIEMLAVGFDGEWSAAKLDSLLAQVGFAGKSLDDWLRDEFFEQHCEIFHQRPFVWHIWDGRRDGFHALVNYHRLTSPNGEGRRTLEKLLFSYLGDWIDRQRADQAVGVEGADARVIAAEHLKSELNAILDGEPPYDLFVRWKPLHKQPMGWEPDIDDGVRQNIRPFMMAKPLGARAKGACILRATPKIKWDKDRGKELQLAKEDFPWLWNCDGTTADFLGGRAFDGIRWNDLHYSRAVKETARARGRS